MAEPGDVLENPAMGTTVEFVETSSSSDARRLVMDWTLPPGRRTVSTNHLHRWGAERWEVLDGRAGYRIGRDENTADAGAAWDIPVKTAHVHPWNAGDGPLRVRQIVASSEGEPPLIPGVERFFETLCALGQQGKTDEKGDIRSRLQAAITIREFLMPNTYLVGPPRFLQDALFATAAAIARLAGRSAYVEPERAGR